VTHQEQGERQLASLGKSLECIKLFLSSSPEKVAFGFGCVPGHHI